MPSNETFTNSRKRKSDDPGYPEMSDGFEQILNILLENKACGVRYSQNNT